MTGWTIWVPPDTDAANRKCCSYLLVFVLGHVGFELEVAAEFCGTELALVRAVDQDQLLVLGLVGPFRLGRELSLALI